jgi:hypothetical protein
MKKSSEDESDADLAAEYDFSGGVRREYAARFVAESKIVVISPNVAQLFPDSASVNSALRTLAKRAPLAKVAKDKARATRPKTRRS